MAKRIALVTCSKYPGLTASDRILAAALRDDGAHAVAVDWLDHRVAWHEFDLAVVRSTWDYHLRPDEFSAWIGRVAAATRLVNAAELMLWNSNKDRYLADLLGHGVPVLPFAAVGPGSAVPHRWWEQLAGEDIVIKPPVGASAWQIFRVRAGDLEGALTPELRKSGYLVQAYAPEIEAGEYSIIFFGADYSHTVLKKPRPGDFRTQPELGATQQLVQSPDALIAQAREVLACLPVRPTYARIDGIIQGGRFVLMEAELIEPELFFHLYPAGAQTFATSLLALL